MTSALGPVAISHLWLYANFGVFLLAFAVALRINFNFNAILVGLIYLLPLIPAGITPENAVRFHLVSFNNFIFGLLEITIFAATVRRADITFDKEFMAQLSGHVLPIAAALLGLSFAARASTDPVTPAELLVIFPVFATGVILRLTAVRQLGLCGFKFDIAFREEQTLATHGLYAHVRHPSYAAMMIVIAAYALTAHSWLPGGAGLLAAWYGFHYRILREDKALEQRFGRPYAEYRAKTPAWVPRLW